MHVSIHDPQRERLYSKPVRCARMRVLVLGGAGFVGSHLIPALIHEGHEVTVQEIVAQDDATRIREFLPSIHYLWKSMLDITASDISGFDWVINLAAITDVPLAISSPRWCWHENTNSVLAVLEAIRGLATTSESGGQAPGLIFMSTESVYGVVPKENHPIREETAFNPVNVYGATKVAAEMLIKAYVNQIGIKALVLRSTSMFGERCRPKQVIPIFITQALAGRDITIEGDGSQSRDFSYVGNTVHAILLAMKHNETGVWNLGCGSECSIGDMAKLIVKLTNSPSKIIFKPWRAGEKGVQLPMSIDKARRELGYTPAFNLKEGLLRTIEWFRAMS